MSRRPLFKRIKTNRLFIKKSDNNLRPKYPKTKTKTKSVKLLQQKTQRIKYCSTHGINSGNRKKYIIQKIKERPTEFLNKIEGKGSQISTIHIHKTHNRNSIDPKILEEPKH